MYKRQEEDIKKIRRDIIEKIVKSGANEKTVDVTIEVDAQKNILRAIATGATELRQKDLGAADLKQEELQTISSEALGTPKEETNCVAASGRWNVYEAVTKKKDVYKRQVVLLAISLSDTMNL